MEYLLKTAYLQRERIAKKYFKIVFRHSRTG